MPPLIRKTIEDYFVEGKLSYLVCTSTLLQGVNLPAKNLFMLDPAKGVQWDTREDIPISSVDFWNLAGRAGRLGKDFEGNVFMIDYDRWQSNPLSGNREQTVVPTFYNHITERREELINFIRSAEHPSGKVEDLENSFVKLFNDFRKGRLDDVIQRSPVKISTAAIKELIEALQEVEKRITMPSAILERHPSVSVYRQQGMFAYLCKRIREDGPDHFIPMHPLNEWADVHKNYIRLFKRIHSYFQGWPPRDKRHTYFAPLAIRWMRGDALVRLIDDAYQYQVKHRQRAPSIATVIRQVLSDIEQDLRFRYVKYMSCYNDILAQALRDCDFEDLVLSIPPIPLFLELGASSKTMVSMIGMGLSRTTAVVLSRIVVDKNMDRKQVMEWLKQRDLETLDISPICIREIYEMLGKHSV